LLCLGLLAACVGEVHDAHMDASVSAADAEAGRLRSPEARSRSPWFEEAQDVARRYPAYGVTLHHMTYVYEQPKRKVRPIGYLRRGSRFRASEEISRGKDCERGWFEVLGGGYFCNGEGVSIDSQPPPFDDSPVLPALGDPFPYRYRKIVTHGLVQYLKLPTPAEENAALAAIAMLPVQAGTLDAPALPLPNNVRMRMEPGFYVSLDREVDAPDDGRPFVRTVRGGFVRREQLTDAMQPPGMGVGLGEQHTLPLAFVFRSGAPVMERDPVSGELVKTAEAWPLHGAHSLTGESLVKQGRRYFVTRDGRLLRDNAVRIVDRVARPKLVGRKERWIRVDLERQTLTAYEGDVPVFATLVSSGVPDHATPTGLYRIHAKHVTTTMDDMAADGAYSIEDVPWTMYFLGSYALHAAFWHDKFGNRRSHGCVNLPPRDARWLFFWTLPELPSGWHGAFANVGKGTSVLLDTGVPYAVEHGGTLPP
jgi:hypothetical protein